MEDPKQERAGSQKSTEDLLKERQSDATDDKTLREVEESRRSLDSGKNDRDRTPSPDGAFDESDETKDAGPM